MKSFDQNEKDTAVIGLLHGFVSLGVLFLCASFVVKTLLVFNYNQHACWENFIYFLDGMIVLLPLFFLGVYSAKSISRLYLDILTSKAHWFYVGVIILAGASMALVFPAFNFLNSSLPSVPSVPSVSGFTLMEYIKVFFTILTAVLGWIVAHYFTSKRDLKSSRRLARIEALSNCYKIFIRVGINGALINQNGTEIEDKSAEIEDAIAIIHLYGSQEQSDLVNQYVNNMSSNQTAVFTNLIDSLRENIRNMLGEEDLKSTPSYLKISRGK